jgi:hypothetical protein
MRPMFGLLAFQNHGVVFATLPDKRAIGSPNAIAYKLAAAGRLREGEKWQFFEVETEKKITAALAHLTQAYMMAAGRLG